MTNFASDLPTYAVFLTTLLSLALSLKLGLFFGRQSRSKIKQEKALPLASVVASILNMLALILAFSFGMAASFFSERRVLVIKETNAIETTYLRSQYLPAPYNSNVQNLLKFYLATRVETIKNRNLGDLIQKSDHILEQLWTSAQELAQKFPNSVSISLFILSVNQVIDLHSERLFVGLQTRIPDAIWAVLYILTIMSIWSLGFQYGHDRRSYTGVTIGLIIIIAVVLSLIADLDHPSEGFIRANQQPTIDLLYKFTTKKAETKPGLGY